MPCCIKEILTTARNNALCGNHAKKYYLYPQKRFNSNTNRSGTATIYIYNKQLWHVQAVLRDPKMAEPREDVKITGPAELIAAIS